MWIYVSATDVLVLSSLCDCDVSNCGCVGCSLEVDMVSLCWFIDAYLPILRTITSHSLLCSAPTDTAASCARLCGDIRGRVHVALSHTGYR